MDRRLEAWQHTISKLGREVGRTMSSNIHVSAWPMAFQTGTYMFRSAFAVSPTEFYSLGMRKPYEAKQVDVELTITTCVLAVMAGQEDEPSGGGGGGGVMAKDRESSLNHGPVFQRRKCRAEMSADGSKIFVRVDTRASGGGGGGMVVDVNDGQQWALYLGNTNGQSLVLPVERLPHQSQSSSSSSQVHFCTHGVIYPELKYGGMPEDHAESFVAHYARLGVDHLHLYTNSTYYASTLVQASKRALRAHNNNETTTMMNVWVHDTALPKLMVERSELGPIENKIQHFAINDCLARAYSMGASYIMMGDLDEYSFPTKKTQPPLQHVKLAARLLDEEVAISGRTRLNAPHILYQTSHLFNTLYCAAGAETNKDDEQQQAKYIYDRFTVSQLDSRAYAGRRKAIFVVGSATPHDITRTIFLDVHDAAGVEVQQACQSLHVHHYREGWHADVCTKQASGKDTTAVVGVDKGGRPWTTDHANCGGSLMING